jgi:ATP-dependent helicase/nuclease subunit B
VFIIGMVDGDIPFLSAGNVFLREREVACMGLMGAQEQLRHERFYFLSALMSSNVRTYISRAGSNGRDTLVPSYFFDELEAAFDLDTFGGGTEESSTLCCHRLIGEMISKKRDVAEVRTALAMPLEDICRRIAVECDERDGDCTSTHEGVFADAAIISELNSMLARREAISVSRLESYARCPFTCYLESVMRIEPRPEAEEEFSSADRGVLFHRIVRRFYSELRQNGSTRFTGSQLDEMTARIMSIGREELERYGLDGPPWQAFRATLLGSGSRKGLLRAFLEKEAARGSSFEPKFFELSFGLPLDGGSDASSIDRPVAIDLGGESMMLHGRIDRVDMLPDGKFVVIDYKTGSSTPTVSNIEQGTALQLPLYIQAIETMMPGTKGIGGAYYIVRSEAEIEHKCVFGDKGHVAELKPYFGERRHYREDFRDIVHGSNDHVRSYLEGMRAGRFHPNIGPAKCPRNCSYRTICRNDGNRDGGDDAAD